MTQQKLSSIRIDEHPELKLTLEETEYDGTVIIHQSGLIDTYNTDFFREQVNRVIDAGYPNIIIDAGATTFMSSTGIGAYTSLLKAVRKNNGSLAIYGMSPKIFEVFQLLGFSSFFRFCGTRKEALEMLDADKRSPSSFPANIQCPVCRKTLRAVRSGRFRCSSCKVILAVDHAGSVHLS